MVIALSNHTINRILFFDKYTKNIYRGQIVARENPEIKKIVASLPIPSIVLYNTDTKEGYGLHWLVVIYLKNKTIFYDPLGYTPVLHALPFVASRKRVPVLMNTHNTQLLKNSSYCGHFVIVYTLLLARGKTLFQINNLFTKNTALNEIIAGDLIKWLEKIMKKSIKTSK